MVVMDAGYATARPRTWSARTVVLIVLGTVGALAIVCVGGVVFLVGFGMRELSSQVRAELQGNRVLLEKVGRITQFDAALGDSMAVEEDDVFVFAVRGSKARGTVTAKCVSRDDGTEEVVWARLRLDSGEEFDLLEKRR
jgi:hypothetical protein